MSATVSPRPGAPVDRNRQIFDLSPSERITEIIDLTGEGNLIAEVTTHKGFAETTTHWTVAVNGQSRREVFPNKEAALLRWVDVSLNGWTSLTYQYADKLLRP